MATDTARIELELASGRNESTAPFHQTAERRRNPSERSAVSDEPPAGEQTIIDVPLADAASPSDTPVSQSEIPEASPRIGPPIWIALVAALLILAAVWWVMLQRLPDADPSESIRQHLGDAQQAVNEGRYTDPPERSALHYYTTVLELDPNDAQAIAGIDAIADRHLTDARVLLADQRVAEAAVALEKARRVRPNHSGLLVLDTLLRVELRKILASASAVNAKPVEKIVTRSPARPAKDSPSVRSRATDVPPPTAVATAVPAPEVTKVLPEPVSSAPLQASLARAGQTLALGETNTPLAAPRVVSDNAAGSGFNVEEPAPVAVATSPLTGSAPPAVPYVEPKLIKMVQPEYPQEASMRGIEGWVEVSLQVTAAGDVIAPRIEETSRGRLFNRAALIAVQQWKYEPRAGGAPAERVRVRLQFRQSN